MTHTNTPLTDKESIDDVSLWTKHYATARSKPKMRKLIFKFKYEGYGWFWALIENMVSVGQAPYALGITGDDLLVLAADLMTTPEQLTDFFKYTTSSACALFEKQGDNITCPELIRILSMRDMAVSKMRDKLKQAGKKRWEFRDKTNVEWWTKYVDVFRDVYPKAMKSQVNDPQVERELFYACLVDGEPNKEQGRLVLHGTEDFARYIARCTKEDVKYELTTAVKWLKSRGWMHNTNAGSPSTPTTNEQPSDATAPAEEEQADE